MRCASVFLLVTCLLGAAQADSQETCLEFDADLVAGIPVEIVLEDEIWLDPSTSLDSGALWLETTLGHLAATSRTYNLTGDGTFGQFIPAESRYAPTAVTAIGIDKSADYRTNIGLFNPWDSDSTVTISLISDQGSLLASHTLVIGSRRHHQINDIFRALGVAPRMNCRVDLRGEPLGVLGYASVIDNRTGDAVYIPAR